MCRKLTAKVVWVMSSFIVCVAMAMVTILSSWSLGDIGGNVQDAAAVDKGLKSAALALFVALGFPFAVSYAHQSSLEPCLLICCFDHFSIEKLTLSPAGASSRACRSCAAFRSP